MCADRTMNIYPFRPSDANLQEVGEVMYRQFQERAEKLVREKALESRVGIEEAAVIGSGFTP